MVAGSDADDVQAWDAVADTYAAAGDSGVFDEFLQRHLGSVAGKRVLDLGCGDGWFASALQARGADVVAVDGSERLLELGRAKYPDVDFQCVDLRAGIGGTYDAVVALMVLMDLPTLDAIRPTVTTGGVLVATILHPAFFNQRTVDDEDGGYRQVRGYLDEEEWWIESFGGHRHYHRSLGYYAEWIASLGLGIVELFEPVPSPYTDWRARIPTRLGIAARPVTT